MKKFKPILHLLLILPLFLVLSLSGCLQPEKPVISFKNADYSFVSFQEIEALFHFTMANPNGLPLHGTVEYNLIINNENFLSGKSTALEVGAKESADFSISSKVNLTEVFGLLSTMIEDLSKGASSIPYKIEGTFTSSVAGFPLEVPLSVQGDIPLPKLPTIELENISIAKIDLTGATFRIQALINNINNFPLNIEAYLYTLTSGENTLAAGSIETPLTIAPHSSGESVWNVKVSFKDLDNEIINMIKNQTIEAELSSTIESIK